MQVARFAGLRQLTCTTAQSPSIRICIRHTHHVAPACTSYQRNYGKSHHPWVRSFHSTHYAKAVKDSTIDSAYMPRFEIEEQIYPEIRRIPLLPDNYSPIRSDENAGTQQESVEAVVRPEISTVSADGTHIDCPSAMSEVTDNHSIELDPYNLTSKVAAAAAKMAGTPAKKLKESGVVVELWNGLLDDLLGSRKLVKA